MDFLSNAGILGSLILDSPMNTPLRSMVISFAVIIPSIRPCAFNSSKFTMQFPRNLPATSSASAVISPLIIPLLPIITVFLELILPSNSPSMCSLQSVFISPLILVPCAMIVAPPLLFPLPVPLDCLSSLAKIAIVCSFLFQRLMRSFSYSS